MMNKQQQENLENLRNSVEQDDWMLCKVILAKLLSDLKQTDAVKIIVKRAHRFLSDLSRAFPEDENIARSIDMLINITSLEMLDQQGKLIDPLLEKYWKWPGVSNFRNAFKGISKPRQYFEHSGEYIDTVGSMLSHILIATEANNYYGGNSEFSETFFGSDNRKALMMLVKHHSDPKHIAIRVSVWTELANDLDLALQVG
jgi:hypothetical protein